MYVPLELHLFPDETMRNLTQCSPNSTILRRRRTVLCTKVIFIAQDIVLG